MRLGLIARADNRGLGQQTWAYFRHLNPAKTMVVDCPSQQPLPLHLDRFPGAAVVHGLPTAKDFRWLAQNTDVILTAETGYGAALWDEAEKAGTRTVLASNFEFLNRADRPTLWAAPSLWHYEDIPDRKAFLPVPVETDRFPIRRWPVYATAKNFVHIVGRPTWNGSKDLHRNGTIDVIKALRYVTAEVSVTFRCQAVGYLTDLLRDAVIPANVSLHIHHGDTENYWTAYENADVLLLPRRFGGLSLPVNEALGAGIPTLMTDIAPNNQWLPKAWLVPASYTDSFVAKQRIDTYTVDHQQYADRIDTLASSARAFADARMEAQRLAGELSWDSLVPLYRKTFEEL